ncbi:MAG: hypothetical protein SFV15_23260 [Polyangiaceae bacterium]|nr:hypothetical protein [Polyangiaceae bacterium]
MRFVVATHGHCFDGLASATLFTRLLQQTRKDNLDFVYRACGYGLEQTRADEGVLDGEENAILDYRYHPSARLNWFFDHHRTSFQTPGAREHFDAHRAGGQFFFDAGYSSCTRLVSDVAAKEFGVTDASLKELVDWADKIDAARFSSAAEAINHDHAVMRLATVVEHHADDAFLEATIPELLAKPLLVVANSTRVQEAYAPLGKKHLEFIELMRSASRLSNGVVLADLTSELLPNLGKFVTYALYPQSIYSVVVGITEAGAKISVGYNPWSGSARTADISQICARYGGGGHPFVGGMSFATKDVETARAVAKEVARELES